MVFGGENSKFFRTPSPLVHRRHLAYDAEWRNLLWTPATGQWLQCPLRV